MSIILEPIGVIYTPFKTKEGMPIQSIEAQGEKGIIKLNEEYVEGLKDLDGFSHIFLIYHFHKSRGFDLHTTPFLDNKKRGVFATRAPKRPNSIGISVVKLLGVDGHTLYVENVDMLNKTPLLDIKPYVPGFDIHQTEKNGWIDLETKRLNKTKSDNRFE